MNNELVTTQQAHNQFQLIVSQAEILAQSRIVPAAYRKQSADIIAAGLAGQSFGWDVMTSLRNYHVIEGSASLRPEAMLGLVRRAGHSVTLDFGETSDGVRYANAHGKRTDTGDEHLAVFTTEDAKRAGLIGKKNWSQYLDSMLTWRAVSALCRVLFPDVVLGAGYVPEEIGGEVGHDGSPVEPDPFADPAISIIEAKRLVLDACDGDKERAREQWEPFVKHYEIDANDSIKQSIVEEYCDYLRGDIECPICDDYDEEIVIDEIEDVPLLLTD